MLAENGLVILERVLAQKSIKIAEPALSSQMLLTKLLKRKAVCLNRFLIQSNVP